MRGITLWQPWASAVALAVKKIETRTWLTQYRGPLAIHAARRWRPQQARFYALHEKTLRRAGLDVERPLPLGEIIAVVELGAIVGSYLCCIDDGVRMGGLLGWGAGAGCSRLRDS